MASYLDLQWKLSVDEVSMKTYKHEGGQIVLIFALSLVALLAFAAFAIDGANVYSVRRTNQSTADSASLAGAGAIAHALKTSNISTYSCLGPLYDTVSDIGISIAQNTAAVDSVTLETNLDNKNGVTTSCGTSNGTPYIDVNVMVTSTINTFFLQVISGEPSISTVEAVARVYINRSFAGGNSIYTTGTTCSKSDTGGGIFVSGTGIINVINGGVYSTSCISSAGSAKILVYNGIAQYHGVGRSSFTTGSVTQTSNTNGLLFGTNAPNYILNDPDLAHAPSISDILGSTSYQLWTGYVPNPSIAPSMWPNPTNSTYPHVMEPMTVPTCPATARTVPNIVYNQDDYILQPGTYSSISWNAWGGNTLTFTPGTYCVSGNVSLGGGSDAITMDGTVIYLTGTNKTFSYGGTNTYSQNNSTIYINNGNFNLASGVTLNANNITIYIKQGNFTISGAGTGYMNAPGCSTSACGVGPSIPGVLLYMETTNTGKVTVAASGTMDMTGTVFAPNSAVYVTGDAGALAMNVQIIGRMVSVEGSSIISMIQDDSTLYSQGSTTIELLR